jgi:hypothetical protein
MNKVKHTKNRGLTAYASSTIHLACLVYRFDFLQIYLNYSLL